MFVRTGIDIGSYSIKVIEVRGFGSQIKVQHLLRVNRRDLVDSEEFSELSSPFVEHLAKVGKRFRSANLALTSREGIIRYSAVPRVPSWRMKVIMEYELEEILSKSGGDGIQADYCLLDPNPERDQVLALIALAKQELVEEKMGVLEAAGISIEGLFPSCLALYRVGYFFLPRQGVFLLLDIGHENTDIVLVEGGKLLFARSVSIGGKLFTEALMEEKGIEFQHAEKMKHSSDISPESSTPPEVKEALLTAAGQLLSVLESTLSFCKNQIKRPDLEVEKFYICGGGANLGGLREYFEAGLEASCEIFSPLKPLDTKGLPKSFRPLLEEGALEFAVPLGLALGSEVDDFSLNLLPVEYRRRHQFWNRTLYLWIAAIFLGIYLLFSLFVGRSLYGKMEVTKQEVEKKLVEYNRWTNELSNLKKKNGVFIRTIQALHRTTYPASYGIQLLEMLSRFTPSGVTLEEFRFHSAPDRPLRFTLSCRADDTEGLAYEKIAQLQRSLASLSFVEKVISSGERSKREYGRERYELEYTLEIYCR